MEDVLIGTEESALLANFVASLTMTPQHVFMECIATENKPAGFHTAMIMKKELF